MDTELYEEACRAYAGMARAMRPGECDRYAMAAAFRVIMGGLATSKKSNYEKWRAGTEPLRADSPS